MSDTNYTSEKIDEEPVNTDPKRTAESEEKPLEPVANSHDADDKGDQQNGEENKAENVAGDAEEVDGPKKDIETAKPVDLVVGEAAEKPATNSHEPTPPVQEEKVAEEKKEAKKPARRGRPAPKAKNTTNGPLAASEEPKETTSVEAETEKKEPEKTEGKKEKSPVPEAEAKTAKKNGRKRRAVPEEQEEPVEKASKPTRSAKETSPSGQEDTKDEKETPIFEKPLVVEGKRQRQKVERYDSTMLPAAHHSKDVTDLPHGSGVKLGDIAYVEVMITKMNADDLKPLHRLCFGRSGQSYEIRKNLRSFCGFDFEKGTELYTRKLKQMDNWLMKQLKQVCEILGLERGGKKEDLQNAIVDFLVKPADAGKKPPQSKKQKSGGGSKKAKSSTAKAAKPVAADSGPDASSETEGETEEVQPKAKQAKKAPPKSQPASSSAPKKKPAGGGKGKATKKAAPSDDALRGTIKELLHGANLEEITMRDMCRKVYAAYPDFDLTSRKDFIKDNVKAIIAGSAE